MGTPRRTRITIGAVTAGMVASAAVSFASSYAAFSSTTTNPGDGWSAGTVVLSDDDSAAMFTTSVPGTGQISGANLKPTGSVVNCIKVSYTGALPATVKMYASSVSGVNGTGATGILAYLHVKIEEGTVGTFGACGAFAATSTIWDTSTHGGVGSDLLSVFPTTYATGPSSGLATWSNGSSRVYRFTFTLDSTTPDTSQTATATATFNWQAQNT
jgi:hypothetical protein